MAVEMILWFIIVGAAIAALLMVWVYEENRQAGHKIHFVEVDHDENFCDDDDCEE